jgi:hypothetical protein
MEKLRFCAHPGGRLYQTLQQNLIQVQRKQHCDLSKQQKLKIKAKSLSTTSRPFNHPRKKWMTAKFYCFSVLKVSFPITIKNFIISLLFFTTKTEKAETNYLGVHMSVTPNRKSCLMNDPRHNSS